MFAKVFGGLIAAWYIVPWAFGVQQELKLKWTKTDLWPRMKTAILFLAMELQGTYEQFIVFGYRILFGKHESILYNYRAMRSFYTWLIPLLFGPMECEGAENIPKGEPVIYVANHQCTMDFAMFFAMPADCAPGLCPVAKTSILAMPGFGMLCLLGGGIMIQRGKKGTMEQVIEQGQERLDDGLSIVLFPQGTRRIPTPDVPPLDFKRGFAVLAAKTKRRVVPLTFLYPLDYMTNEGKSKGVKVIVHKPVSVSDNDESIKAAMASVQATVTGPILADMKKYTSSKETKKVK